MRRKAKKIRKIHIPLLIFLVLLLTTAILFLNNYYGWSTYVTDGPITSLLYKYKNTLVFGNAHSKLYFLDVKNKDNVSKIDLNTGSGQPQNLYKYMLPVISDDTLRLINIKTKKVVWQISSPEQYFFKTANLYKGKLVVGSTDGTLSLHRLKDGKEIWQFKSKPLEKLSSVLTLGSVDYFGKLTFRGNNIYFASQDKTLYNIDFNTGSVKWKIDINDSITTWPLVFGKYIFIGTQTGKIIAIDAQKHKMLWEFKNENPVICLNNFPFEDSEYPYNSKLTLFKRWVQQKLVGDRFPVYQFLTNGKMVARDSESGKILWETNAYGKTTSCPSYWKNYAVFATTQGNLTTIALKNGTPLMEKDGLGLIANPVYIDPRFTDFLPTRLKLFSSNIIFNNTQGKLYSINALSGKINWQFVTDAPTENGFNVYGNVIYFVTSDGVIYKLNKWNGVPILNSAEQQFSIDTSIKKVGATNIYEITLYSKGSFSNPWREALLDATFTSSRGETIQVPGFYYDQNQWKIRFNPPSKGRWNWEINWTPHGKNLQYSGSFESITDTQNFFVKVSKDNPKVLTVDNNTIFNGLGIGDTLIDYNYNGTSLDDWAIGNSERLYATNSAGFTSYYRSDVINSMKNYLNAYGPDGAGFNLFRWSLMNASQPLWINYGFPTEYSLIQGKIGDNLVQNLRNANMHIWFTLFGFDIPYKDSNLKTDRYLLKTYIRYVYARYGAYIDVWELANEVGVPKQTADFIKKEIQSWDYEKRPISISSDWYNVNDGDIIAPHWYKSEDLLNSDIETSTEINKYDKQNKPVVFAEQGNLGSNYDSQSGLRMRIRAWTAFFNNAIFIFWNQTDSKEYKAAIFPGNIYLGEEERKYINILQKFTFGFPLKSEKVSYNFPIQGVRGYGLSSNEMTAAYFYHYGSPFSPTQFSIDVNVKNSGMLKWIDPENGKVIQENICGTGVCRVLSPVFKTDICFKIAK